MSELVFISDGIPTTTSLIIAETFGKRHKDVLRGIEKLHDNCPKEFNGRNFALVEYVDPKGEKRPMYTMTQDGFTLLVMGYTGAKAMQFKLAYIEAFNAMKNALASRKNHASLAASTTADRKPLREIVHAWTTVSGQSHATCWQQVKAAFQLSRIDDLPADWIADAIAWVQNKIDTQPQTSPTLPSPLSSLDIPTPKQARLLESETFQKIIDAILVMYHAASLDRTGDSQEFNTNMQFSTNCLFMAHAALKRARAAH